MQNNFLFFLSSSFNLSNENLESCSFLLKDNNFIKKFIYNDPDSRFLKLAYTLPLSKKNDFIIFWHSSLNRRINSFAKKYNYQLNENIYINNTNVNQILNQFYTINKLIAKNEYLKTLDKKVDNFFINLELDYNKIQTQINLLNSINSQTSLNDLLNVEENYLINEIKLESLNKTNKNYKSIFSSLVKTKLLSNYNLNLNIKDYSSALYYLDLYCKRFSCSLNQLQLYNSLKLSADSLNYIKSVSNIPKMISKLNSNINNEKFLDAMILVQKLKSYDKEDVKSLNLEKIEKKCLKKMKLKNFDIYLNDDYIRQISKHNFVGTYRDDSKNYNTTQLKQAALDDLISKILINISSIEVNSTEESQINNQSYFKKKYYNKTILKSEIDLNNLNFIQTNSNKYNRMTVTVTKNTFFESKLNLLTLLIDEYCKTDRTNNIYFNKIQQLFSILSISKLETSYLLSRYSNCN